MTFYQKFLLKEIWLQIFQIFYKWKIYVYILRISKLITKYNKKCDVGSLYIFVWNWHTKKITVVYANAKVAAT